MGLFDNDPVFAGCGTIKRKLLRNRQGQFATPEQVETERVRHENAVLRRKAEQYKRAWLAVANANTRLTRQMTELKSQLKALINGTAKN